MLSLNDFKSKQILYVNSDWEETSHLKFSNDNIVFKKGEKVVDRVSVHKVFAIFISGDLSLTTNFLKKSKEFGISVFFLKRNMELYASLMSKAEGHYLLRMKQYNMEEKQQLLMAKELIKNKINNQSDLLKEKMVLSKKQDFNDHVLSVNESIDSVQNHKELLGLEGSFSRRYFSNYFRDYGWRRRAPRTKEDTINFLMDMGYTYLFNFTDSLLRLHGFDTFKGFYHRLFFQRRSLSCDIMEPFRPLIDKQIVKAINLKQIKEEDFEIVKGVYCLPFKNYNKYSNLFLLPIMKEKEYIFNYINSFYRHIMNPVDNNFPKYKFIRDF